jgi:hypothetical protein
MAIASTGVALSEMTDVGAKAAASRRVWYPSDDAYDSRDRGFLLLVILDWPVSAKRLGLEELYSGLFSNRMVCSREFRTGYLRQNNAQLALAEAVSHPPVGVAST